MPKRSRTPENVEISRMIGLRVRNRRKALGLNQTDIATHLGVTFQMVQRYEYGTCSLIVPQMLRLAQVLDVPVTFFFEGLDGLDLLKTITPKRGVAEDSHPELKMFATAAGRKFAAAFNALDNKRVRSAIAELTIAAATQGD